MLKRHDTSAVRILEGVLWRGVSLHSGPGGLDRVSKQLDDLCLRDGVSIWSWYEWHADLEVDLVWEPMPQHRQVSVHGMVWA